MHEKSVRVARGDGFSTESLQTRISIDLFHNGGQI